MRLLLKITASLSLIICLFVAQSQPALANGSLIITSQVAAKPSDFEVKLSHQPSAKTIGSGQIITVTLTYGSHLNQATDTVVLVASWQQQPNSPSVLEYLPNSATAATGGTQPTIDTQNKTITWVINPMPPGLNRQVLWKLQVPSNASTIAHNLTITAQLTGPGVQISANPLNLSYDPTLIVQPTTQPSPTQSIQPSQPTISVTAEPSGQPSSTPTLNPTITPSGSSPDQQQTIITPIPWLLAILVLLLSMFILWLLKKAAPYRIWLFLTNQTRIYGQLNLPTGNSKDFRLHLTFTDQSKNKQVFIHHDQTFSKAVHAGNYVLELSRAGQILGSTAVTIDRYHRGQQLKVTLEEVATDTIEVSSNQHEHT